MSSCQFRRRAVCSSVKLDLANEMGIAPCVITPAGRTARTGAAYPGHADPCGRGLRRQAPCCAWQGARMENVQAQAHDSLFA